MLAVNVECPEGKWRIMQNCLIKGVHIIWIWLYVIWLVDCQIMFVNMTYLSVSKSCTCQMCDMKSQMVEHF